MAGVSLAIRGAETGGLAGVLNCLCASRMASPDTDCSPWLQGCDPP